MVSISWPETPLPVRAAGARFTLSSMSTHPSGGVVRLARAAYLAAVILGLAVAGHVLGGGSWPSWGALSGVLILAGGLSAVLTRARLRAPRLAATLAGGQLAVHEVLSWTTGHGSMGHDHAAMALDPTEGMPSGWHPAPRSPGTGRGTRAHGIPVGASISPCGADRRSGGPCRPSVRCHPAPAPRRAPSCRSGA